MTKQNLERDISHLLHEAAGRIPTNVDLLARLHQQLVSAPTAELGGARTLSHLQSAPRLGYAAISILLVAGLLLSAFTFARPLIFSWLGDGGLKGIALQDGTLINQTVTVQGITLHLEQGYADAARTALTMRISSSSFQGAPAPQMNAMYLTDSQGHRYPAFTGTQVQNEGLYEFSPLQQNSLRSEQTLTLVMEVMLLPDAPGSPVTGPWQIPFHISPQAGHSLTFVAIPQTHGGVTMQPERLDLAPGGARLLVRISGLAANTSLSGLAHFATQGPDIIGCPPNGNYCVSSGHISDGALLQLQGPNKQRLAPTWVEVVASGTQDVGFMPSSETVGQSGSAVLEFLFFTPLLATQGTGHLTIDQIHLATVGSGVGEPERIITGPWIFELPLQ